MNIDETTIYMGYWNFRIPLVKLQHTPEAQRFIMLDLQSN
jgi:hypothetical protein